MRVLWWWIPFVVLYAINLNLSYGTFSKFLLRVVLHSTIILGYVSLLDLTFEKFKFGTRKEFGSYLVLVFILYFFLKGAYFITEQFTICPAVELQGDYFTNKYTGECKFGQFGRCDDGYLPWYMERGCDLSAQEKKEIKMSSKWVEYSTRWCKNDCEDRHEYYCEITPMGLRDMKCSELYKCPGTPC